MNQIGNIQPGGNAAGTQYANPAQTIKTQNEEQTTSQQVSAASGTAPAAAQTASPPGTDFSPAYTVEISEEGSQLNSQAASAASAAPTGTPAAGTTTTSETTSDDGSDTATLAIYSDSQLQQMLSSGEITQSEYNAEIARREATKQADAAQDTDRENTLLANVK